MKNSMSARGISKIFLTLVAILLLAACSDSGATPPPTDSDPPADSDTVARVEIRPGGVITLTETRSTITLKAIVYGENDVILERDVTWSVKDEAIADVTASGEVTALYFGETTSVTAETEDGSRAEITISTATLQDGVALQSVNFDDVVRNELLSNNVAVDSLFSLLQNSEPLQFELTFASDTVASFAVGDTLLIQGEEGFVGTILEKREESAETTLLVEQDSIFDVFRAGEFLGTVEGGELTTTVEPISVQTVGTKTIYTFDAQALNDRLSCSAESGVVEFTNEGATVTVTAVEPAQAEKPILRLGSTSSFPFVELQRLRLRIFGKVITNIDLGSIGIEVKPNVEVRCELDLFEVSPTQIGIPHVGSLRLDVISQAILTLSASAGGVSITMELPKTDINLDYSMGIDCTPGCQSLNSWQDSSSRRVGGPSASPISTDVGLSLEVQPVSFDIGASLRVLGQTLIRASFLDVAAFVNTDLDLAYQPWAEDAPPSLNYTGERLSISAGVRGELGSAAEALEDAINKVIPGNSPIRIFGANLTLFELNVLLLELSREGFTLDGFPGSIMPGESYDVVIKRKEPTGTLGRTISETMALRLDRVDSDEQYLFFIEDPVTELTDEGFVHRGIWTAPDTLSSGQWRAFASVSILIGNRPLPFTTPGSPTSITVGSEQAVITDFSALPSNITAGDSATLSWTASEYDSLSITPDIGNVTSDSDSSVLVSPTETTTYTLTATNAAGSVTAQTTVTVTTAGADAPPTASLTASPLNGAVPLTVQFDASESTDDNGIASYRFSFGNGQGSPENTTASAQHTYNTTGTYTASVRPVTDTAGQTSTDTVTITVEADGEDQVCEGDFRIEGGSTEQVIAEVSNCSEITGNLKIVNTSLESLSFLAKLTRIEGDLEIAGNDSLTSLRGPENLASVRALSVFLNASLTSLRGLESLTSVRGGLEIADNAALTSLSGTENIEEVQGNAIIYDNPSLNCTLFSNFPYMPIDESYGNLLNCPTESESSEASGLVTRASDGSPLSAAIVTLGNSYATTSGSDGRFVFETVEPGNYQLLITKSGFVDLAAPVTISASGSNSLGTFALEEGTNGEGQICEGSYVVDGSRSNVGRAITEVSNCVEITGSLEIEYMSSEDLSFLAKLTSVGETLTVNYNATLTSLSGLESLTNVGRNLHIESNNALTSLSSLAGLTSLNSLIIIQNDVLTSLGGLEALTELRGGLLISNNNALMSLDGLRGLSGLVGGLNIISNATLTSLSGLEGVTNVSYIRIHGNDALISLDGTGNIAEDSGYTQIFQNPNLDCRPYSEFPYMPVDESYGNLVDCPTGESQEPTVTGVEIVGIEKAVGNVNCNDNYSACTMSPGDPDNGVYFGLLDEVRTDTGEPLDGTNYESSNPDVADCSTDGGRVDPSEDNYCTVVGYSDGEATITVYSDADRSQFAELRVTVEGKYTRPR
ncbi:MAG: PKD domain-containing protein [Trueperaceae bacterium]|nr:PKD domain-containing protein [Trueperaceae bacterium]